MAYDVLDRALSFRGAHLRVLVRDSEITTSFSDTLPFVVLESATPHFSLDRHFCALEHLLSHSQRPRMKPISPLEEKPRGLDALSKGLVSPITFLQTPPNHRGVLFYHEHGYVRTELYDSRRECSTWGNQAPSFSEALQKLSRRAWWGHYFGI